MAYTHYYTIALTNDLYQTVSVKIYKKDAAAPASIGTYECTGCTIERSCDQGETGFTKYGTLISSTLSFGLWVPDGDTNVNPITWETFITSNYDAWKVIVDIDGDFYFHGFLAPDEGNALFQDAPYEVVFTATDGLKLLEKQELVKYDGTRLKTFDRDLLITFIVGALSRTGLDLPIRIYCNYFHNSMLDRGDGLQYDMFNQVEVNRRTFLADVDTFENCYKVLGNIFTQFCTLEYYKGMWQIVSIPEKQYLPGSWWYTDYQANGTIISGALVTDNHAQVGKDVDIFPIRANQYISSRYALKSARHYYTYTVPEELLPNIALARLGDFIAPLSGTGYTAWELTDWTVYKGQPQPVADQDPSTANAYIKIEVDAFGTQTDRYIVVEKDATAPATVLQNYIRNDNADFYGEAGDKVSISVTFRTRIDESSGPNLLMASFILLKDGESGDSAGHWYGLNDTGVWSNAPNVVFCQYNITEDTSQWKTVTFDDLTIPATGTFYLLLGCGKVNTANESHFKDIRINNTLYIRGSLFNMKADYWKTSQDNVFPDTLNEEQFISDSPKRIIKGGLWFNGALLSPSWHRYPATEVKAFKELINIGRYNHSYRRMYAIDGTFQGLNYSPENDGVNKYPIGFHTRYRFVDMTPDRDFILTPPLTMDLLKGEFTATFVEVIKDSADGTQAGDDHEFNYIF